MSTFFFAEIISVIAIVISLINLAIEMRQTRKQSITESMDQITQERADFVKLLATESELSRIIAAGLSSATRLKPAEYFRFTSYLYYLFVQLELGFRKRQRGHIDDDLWNGWNEAVKWWIRCPGTRDWWKFNPAGGFTPKFKKYINEIIASVEAEEPAVFANQLEFLGEIALTQNEKSKEEK